MMKTKIWMCAATLLLAAACGDKNNDSNDDNVIPGNVRPNNETNNGSNGTNNPPNNETNNDTNNGSNNGSNNSNNGTNNNSNNATNNNSNNATNNQTNNMTLGPGEVGTATVDIAVTLDGQSAQMTSCEWMAGTAQVIAFNTNPNDGSVVGQISCQVMDPANANGVFIVDIQMLDSSVGTNAATTMFIDCNQNGCSGNSQLTVAYVDFAAGVDNEVSTATSMDEGGNMVINAFDPVTAVLDGEVNAVIRENGIEATLVGTFSADLADCTDRPACVGDGN